MANITYTNTFSDGDSTDLGTKIQENFDDAKDVLNGNLGDTNIGDTSIFTISSLTCSTSITIPLFETNTDQDQLFILGSGTHKLIIGDSAENSLFEVDSDGNMTIPLDKTNLFPVGMMSYFTGSWVDNTTIPGWYKCDGNNDTPDLKDTFIRGGDTSGKTGGSNDVTTVLPHNHTASSGNNSASHTHSYSFGNTGNYTYPSHSHSVRADSISYAGSGNIAKWPKNTCPSKYSTSTSIYNDIHAHSISITTRNQSASHNHTITVNNYGSSGTDKNIPAYYTLIPIKKVI